MAVHNSHNFAYWHTRGVLFESCREGYRWNHCKRAPLFWFLTGMRGQSTEMRVRVSRHDSAIGSKFSEKLALINVLKEFIMSRERLCEFLGRLGGGILIDPGWNTPTIRLLKSSTMKLSPPPPLPFPHTLLPVQISPTTFIKTFFFFNLSLTTYYLW